MDLDVSGKDGRERYVRTENYCVRLHPSCWNSDDVYISC